MDHARANAQGAGQRLEDRTADGIDGYVAASVAAEMVRHHPSGVALFPTAPRGAVGLVSSGPGTLQHPHGHGDPPQSLPRRGGSRPPCGRPPATVHWTLAMCRGADRGPGWAGAIMTEQ